MKGLSLSLVLCALVIVDLAGADVPDSGLGANTIRVKQGSIQGSVMQSLSGRDFHAFRGIPFGKVTERFKEAEPAEPWTGILNATSDAPECLQYDFWYEKKMLGVEDCLTLNVYTPKLPENGKSSDPLPVMVYIHGGGFLVGSGSAKLYGPERFLNNDIVLVVIQYRLGPFGFLSTHDNASQGNYGLLDQNLALKWVKENAQDFGGNSSKVTIFGESAGSVSVSLHVLSPLSKGLFEQAITQSGSALCPWAVQENPLETTKIIAKELNCSTEDTQTMVECLRRIDAAAFCSAVNATGMYQNFHKATVAVVETKDGGKFLTESPWKLFKEGDFNKVPMIIGVTEEEGTFVMSFNFTNIANEMPATEKEFRENQLPNFIEWCPGIANVTGLDRSVQEMYFKDMNYSSKADVLTRVATVVTDAWFRSCVDSTIRYITAQDVPVYMYVYDYVTDVHSFSNFTGKPDVSHGVELSYQFTMGSPNFNNDTSFTQEERKVSQNIVDMWTTFAKTSAPTSNNSDVEWNPTPKDELKYLRIKAEPKMETGFIEEKRDFWKSIYEDTV